MPFGHLDQLGRAVRGGSVRPWRVKVLRWVARALFASDSELDALSGISISSG